jgi:enamine deaminase RidA (YjgF/YER057c/UK114 family)
MSRFLAPSLLALIPSLLAAQQGPVRARDSSYVRGDRTIYHQHAPSETQWGYAQAVVVGNTIYVSGTISGGKTLDEEVDNIYRRIERTLTANGFTMQDVVKETVYAKDIEAFATTNPTRLRYYKGHTPAATWVQITRLLAGPANVEIEITAQRRAAGGAAPPAP